MPATDRWKAAVIRAALRAKQAALAAAREADRLYKEARKRAASEVRRRQIKQKLQRAGRVLKAASKAALAAGAAAARTEMKRPRRTKGRRRS